MRETLMLLLLGGMAVAAPLTVVQDTMYKADGSPFNGIAQIEWKSFRTADGTQVPQNSVQIRVSNGHLNVSLVPTTNAQKPVFYTVRFNSEGRTQFIEYWSVPQSVAPVRLEQIRTNPINTTPPPNLTAIAIQDISGLRTELDLRPLRGAGYKVNRAAVIGPTGGIEAAVGDPNSCIRVDGTAGPCGSGGGGGGGSTAFVDAETPGGTIDGVNTLFELSRTPLPASSVQLYRNGMLQKVGDGYTLTDRAINFAPGNAPISGDQITAWYRVTADPVNVFADPETPSGAMNGANADFTLTGIPMPAASLMVFRNGLLMKEGVDYTLSLDRITFLPGAVPQSGDTVQASYRK